jgi:hypothetical protein
MNLQAVLAGVVAAVSLLSAAPALAKDGHGRKAACAEKGARARIDGQEARELRHDRRKIKALKRKAAADGVITRREHRQIKRAKHEAKRDFARAQADPRS